GERRLRRQFCQSFTPAVAQHHTRFTADDLHEPTPMLAKRDVGAVTFKLCPRRHAACHRCCSSKRSLRLKNKGAREPKVPLAAGAARQSNSAQVANSPEKCAACPSIADTNRKSANSNPGPTVHPTSEYAPRLRAACHTPASITPIHSPSAPRTVRRNTLERG